MTKTGTTALEACLDPLCDIRMTGDPRIKHMQLRKFERFVRPLLATLGGGKVETTCLFRQPEDWLGSWYRYRARPQIAGTLNSTTHMDFEAFVTAYLMDDPPPFAKVGRQARFVTNKNGEMGVDHLFRYENFTNYVAFLEARFSTRFAVDQRNVSPKIDLNLSTPLRQRLQEVCAADYEIYENVAR